jgi:hypothetical protein
MSRVPSLQSFNAWLAHCPEPRLRAILNTRRDLLRRDAANTQRIAGAAGTRAGVARGLESLDTGALQLACALAVRSRVTPDVSFDELPAGLDPRAFDTLADTALIWPAGAESQDSAEPASMRWRIQSEAVSLLPTSARDQSNPPAWLHAEPPRAPVMAPVSQAIARNAQAGAAAQVVGDIVALVREVAARPASQLVKGGIGKRDLMSYASRTGAGAHRSVLLLELAGRLGLLGVGGPDADPVWLPTNVFESFAAGDRAAAYARVVEAWLALPVEVGQVVAGRDGTGAVVHALSSLGHSPTSPFSGFPISQPVMPLTRYLLLTDLDALGARGGFAAAAAAIVEDFTWHHPLLPSADEPVLTEILAEAEYLGLVTTPLARPDSFGLTPVGVRLAAHLAGAMPRSGNPLPFDLERLTVPQGWTDLVAGLLPPLERTVVLQSDLTAVATGPLEPTVATALERVADVETRGQGTVFRFTEASLRRGLEDGLSAADVLALIAGAADGPLVPTLEFLIEETAARMHRVRLAPARSVIVVDDPDDLTQIVNEPILLTAGIEQLTSTVATARVSQERLAELLAAADIHTLGAQSEHTTALPAPITAVAPIKRRSLRVGDRELSDFEAALLTERATGTPGTPAAPVTVADRLREASATGAEVVLETVSHTGEVSQLRLYPTAVTAGRVRGLRVRGHRGAAPAPLRAGAAGLSEVSLPLARIRSVRPAGEPGGTTPNPSAKGTEK